MKPSKPVAKPIRPTPKRPAASRPGRWAVKKTLPSLAPAKKKTEKKPAVEPHKPAAKKQAAKPVKKSRTRKAKRVKKPMARRRKPAKKAGGRKRKPAKKSTEKIPKKVKKALRESAVSKSKIARMMKSKGPGWHGESIRHHKAALKAWETRRKRQLKYLEKKEKKKGLSKAETKKKKDLGKEVVTLSKAIAGLEGHLKEIEKYKKAEKPHKLSVKAVQEARRAAEKTAEAVKIQATTGLEVMRETRRAAERTAEAAKAQSPKATEAGLRMIEGAKRAAEKTAEAATAMSKTFAKAPGPPVNITLGAIERAEVGGDTGEEIALYRKLIKRTQYDFFKRVIKEPEYLKRLSEYRHELAELEERKKIAAKKPKREAARVSKKALAHKARDLAHRALRSAEARQAASTGRVVHEPGPVVPRETVSAGTIPQRPAQAVSARAAPAKAIPQRPMQTASAEAIPARAIPRMPVQVAPARATRQKPRQGAPRKAGRAARVVQKPVQLTPKAIKVLEGGTPPEVTDERVAEIEEHIGELLKKYKIPTAGTERESLNKDRIIQDFDKLINLIELEKRAKKFAEEKPAETSRIELPRVERKKKEIKAIEKEIKKYRIVTDFDRVLSYVREKGKVSEGKARKELKMAKKQFKECRNILDKSGLIKIVYPPIGGVQLADVNYKGKKKKNKKKR